jgi:hypothetical protein
MPKPKNPDVKVRCIVCGKEELKPPYRAKRYKTCSVACRTELSSETLSGDVTKECEICGIPFKTKRSHYERRKTCSKKCDGVRKQTMYLRENNPNYANLGERNPLFKDGERITRYGYKDIYKPDHPNSKKDGYIFEHRYVMSEYLGRPLFKWEVVHHIDENKINNDISNLEVMTLPEHQRYHNSLKTIIRDSRGRILGTERKTTDK